IRAHGEDEVLVAPLVDVAGEDVRTRTQSGHPSVLRGGRHLRMRAGVPVIGAWVGGEHFFERVEEQLHGLITVAVHMDEQAGPVKRIERAAKLFQAHIPYPIWLITVVSWRSDSSGESLQ